MKKRLINYMQNNFEIYPLNEKAICIDFGNIIDENTNDIVLALAQYCMKHPFIGLIEWVPAYSSLTLFYDLILVKMAYPHFTSAYQMVSDYLRQAFDNIENSAFSIGKTIQIPVIYDGEDLPFVAEYHGLSVGEVVEIHTSPIYRVFMMGFLPGFAYMGGLDAQIATPRKTTPRRAVPAGSVGIAGMQTGIYPAVSPGGWQLIGRTKLELFMPFSTPKTLIQAGDKVKFVSITS